MQLFTEIESGIHEIIDLPCIHILRRETGMERLVTYRHKETENWIVALQSDDGRSLWEIDTVDGTNEGKGMVPTRQHILHLINKVKNGWDTPVNLTKKRKEQARDKQRDYADRMETFEQAMGRCYRDLRQKYGAMVADRWRHNHQIPCKGPDVMVGT